MDTDITCVGCGIAVVGLRTCPGCGAALEAHDLPGPRLPQGWELTAPESYLLRYVSCGATDAGALKLALIELLAREALRLDGALIRRRWGPGTRSVWLLSDGPRMASIDEPALVPVLALHAHLRERRPQVGFAYRDGPVEVEGVLVTDLVRAGARGRAGFRDYLDGDVASCLQRRGRLSRGKRRTPAGDRAEQQLDEWLEIGKRKFPRWSHDPAWQRAYLQGAGAAVLLFSGGYPALTHTAGRVAHSGTSQQAYAIAVGPENGDTFSPLSDVLDFAALDGVFDILDASFVASGVGFGEGGFGDGGGG